MRVIFVAWALLILVAIPLSGAVVFGPCTAIVTGLPLAAYMGVYRYAGAQLDSNRRAERAGTILGVLDPDTYTDAGRMWLRRTKLLFLAFPLVGLAFGWIGRAVCLDFPR